MKWVLFLISLVPSSVASQVRAQESAFHWSLSAGPTISVTTAAVEEAFYSACDTCVVQTALIFSGKNGRYHAALGVSRAVKGSALVVRGEALYSRSSSPAGKTRIIGYPGFDRRFAPRDEVFVVSAGLQWDAFPGKQFSPYLWTSAGAGINRVSWNNDPASRRIDEQADRVKLFRGLGGGVRVRTGRREWFIEWRSYSPINGGSTIAPLSLGVRF